MYYDKTEKLLNTYENARNIQKGIDLLEIERYKEILRRYNKIFLFGGGKDASMMVRFVSEALQGKEFKIEIIDNDMSKQNTEILPGIWCYGKERMFGCNPNDTIILVASSFYADELYAEIHPIKPDYAGPYQEEDKLGNTYIDKTLVKILLDYNYNDADEYIEHKEEILKTVALYEDDVSRLILYRYLFSKLSKNRYMKDVALYPQYYPPEIQSRLKPNEVFVDCGAYTGDTIEQFISVTDNQFSKIYAFEIDRHSFGELTSKFYQDKRIVLQQIGISDTCGKIQCCSAAGPGTSFVLYRPSGKLESVNVNSLDNLMQCETIKEIVSFVKMDIEGAELLALHGMVNLLKKYRPKLAICVYHKPEDIWAIPVFIKKIVPEYKFFLRHHHPLGLDWETVLYAFIE